MALFFKIVGTFVFLEAKATALQWPAGLYGLPQAQTGCPSSKGYSWETGYRFQDLSDNVPKTTGKSSSFHLAGNVNNNNVRRDFCIKTTSTSDTGRPNWPKGKYCFYRRGGSCPVGFSSGWIKWDDNDHFNSNSKGGKLPDGTYDSDTKIYFCCRGDGDKKEPISLPSDKDFFLLAYQSTECQKVKWFIETTEWINYDTHGGLFETNDKGGSHPYIPDTDDRKIHYCYYKRCQHAYNASSGSFTSPSYPNSYLSGQLCSWRITVPKNQLVKLTFTSFKLEDSITCDADYVAVYDGNDDSSPLIGKYCGSSLPANVISTIRTMFIVLKTDKQNNFAGFAASYVVVAQVGLQWPAGLYGLPQAQTGCPSSAGFQWMTGYRFHDLADFKPFNSDKSSSFHLAANINNNDVRRDFCMKTTTSSDTGRPNWPKGIYCVYRRGGSCPNGFSSGWIKWDDADSGNDNTRGGETPDGIYNSDTVIYFCCRGDGDKKEPISLPSDKDFFLLAYKSTECQKVKWFIETTEWINYDTQSGLFHSNEEGGSYPYIANTRDRKIYYCYYKRCSYTITAFSGTFTSPNYPNNYPSGQYCSWTIKAPQGYNISISFSDFALQSGNPCTADYVAVYDGDKEPSSSLRGKYCGSTKPSIPVSTSNMMLIVFKSDKTNNYKGFKLTFTTKAPATTPSPSTTLFSSTSISPSTPAVPPSTSISPSASASAVPSSTSISPSTTIIPSSTLPSSTVTTRPTEPSTEAASTASPPERNEDRWPAGQYGIPQAISGCPVSSNTTWQTGYRFQDTDDSRTNQRSDDFHLAANVGDDIRRDFCVKTSTADDNVRFHWPTGTYCIYRKGDSCPVGFWSGWVFWDDENNLLGNNNQNGGVLPDGVYDSNTKIFYCCRDDGNKTTPILLPTRDDFLLLAYKSAECQKVDWMNEFSEFIQFATESSLNGDDSAKGGSHPFNATGKDHIVYYCYYQGCKQVLTDQSGVIYSPRYPQNYSTNQRCSWTISPDNVSAIHLNVTFFSLESTADCTADSLLVYDGVDETAPLIGQFCGERPPPEEGIISAGPAVYLLFKSDDVNNFEGFSIKYKNGTVTSTVTTSSTEMGTRATSRPSTTSSPDTNEGHPDVLAELEYCSSKNTGFTVALILATFIIIFLITAVVIFYRKNKTLQHGQKTVSGYNNNTFSDAAINIQSNPTLGAQTTSPQESQVYMALTERPKREDQIYQGLSQQTRSYGNVETPSDNSIETYQPLMKASGHTQIYAGLHQRQNQLCVGESEYEITSPQVLKNKSSL